MVEVIYDAIRNNEQHMVLLRLGGAMHGIRRHPLDDLQPNTTTNSTGYKAQDPISSTLWAFPTIKNHGLQQGVHDMVSPPHG